MSRPTCAYGHALPGEPIRVRVPCDDCAVDPLGRRRTGARRCYTCLDTGWVMVPVEETP